MAVSVARNSQKGLLNRYFILEKEDKRRYKEKLSISGLDPFEILKNESEWGRLIICRGVRNH